MEARDRRKEDHMQMVREQTDVREEGALGVLPSEPVGKGGSGSEQFLCWNPSNSSTPPKGAGAF